MIETDKMIDYRLTLPLSKEVSKEKRRISKKKSKEKSLTSLQSTMPSTMPAQKINTSMTTLTANTTKTINTPSPVLQNITHLLQNPIILIGIVFVINSIAATAAPALIHSPSVHFW